MAFARIKGVHLKGLVTAVPAREVALSDEPGLFEGGPAQMERLRTTLGLDKRRIVPEGMTACDLGEAAVRDLLERTGTDPASVDGLFMVTQTPDHLQPGNALILHGRIGFPATCAAFDLNSGCSGYVYGLWAAHAFIASGGLRKVILVAGDTISRIVSPHDRSTRPLFGDAVAATLLEAGSGAPESFFDLGSDGTGYRFLWQPGGAFREPFTGDSSELKQEGEGILRSRGHLHMDGAEIFNFSLKVGPDAIRAMLSRSGWTVDAVDGFVLHQANAYIIENIRRRLGLPVEQVPSGTVARFGNQSSASIPGTLVDHYGDQLMSRSHRFILSGFGVGLSWATAAIELPKLLCNSLIEV